MILLIKAVRYAPPGMGDLQVRLSGPFGFDMRSGVASADVGHNFEAVASHNCRLMQVALDAATNRNRGTTLRGEILGSDGIDFGRIKVEIPAGVEFNAPCDEWYDVRAPVANARRPSLQAADEAAAQAAAAAKPKARGSVMGSLGSLMRKKKMVPTLDLGRELPVTWRVTWRGGINVRAQPDASSSTRGAAQPYGAVLTAVMQSENWLKLADGKGWIQAETDDGTQLLCQSSWRVVDRNGAKAYESPEVGSTETLQLPEGAIVAGGRYRDGWVSLAESGAWLQLRGAQGEAIVEQVNLQVRVVYTLVCPTVLGKLQRDTVSHKEQLRELRQLAYRSLIAGDEDDSDAKGHKRTLDKLQEKIREQELEELSLHRELKAREEQLRDATSRVEEYAATNGVALAEGAPAAAPAVGAKWRACMEPDRCVELLRCAAPAPRGCAMSFAVLTPASRPPHSRESHTQSKHLLRRLKHARDVVGRPLGVSRLGCRGMGVPPGPGRVRTGVLRQRNHWRHDMGATGGIALNSVVTVVNEPILVARAAAFLSRSK